MQIKLIRSNNIKLYPSHNCPMLILARLFACLHGMSPNNLTISASVKGDKKEIVTAQILMNCSNIFTR